MSTIQTYDAKPALETSNSDIIEKEHDFALDAEKGGQGESRVVIEEVKEALEQEHNFTEAEFKRVKRKADMILLPLLWICYGIQQSDKTSTGTQALYGLQTDTHLVGQQYANLTTFFYVSYLIGEFPSTYMLQRWNMGKGLSIYMMCWACMIIGVASSKNYASLAACRFFQGLFECTISPGFLFIIGSWYKVEEHASRSLFFQSANAGFGIISDLTLLGIARAAAKHPNGIEAWRGMGYFLGGATFLAASFCMVLLGTPSEVWWLNKRDRLIANARILENHIGTDRTGRKHFSKSQALEAFKDPQTWFIAGNTFLSCIPNGGLTTFGSLINKSFGFSNAQVIVYGIPRSIVSVSLFIIIGYSTRRWKGLRTLFMIAGCIPAFLGLLLMSLLPATAHYKWPKWGCYLMVVTFVIPTFMGWQLIPSNVAGKSKRTAVSSINFVAYCTGNMVGSQVFRASDAPRYPKGTAVTAAAIAVETLVVIGLRFYYIWANKRRARKVEEMGLTPEEIEIRAQEAGALDKTDFENPFFTYSL